MEDNSEPLIVDEIQNLEEKIEEHLSVLENPPEHIDLDNYSEDEIEDGTLTVEPEELVLLFNSNDEIPQSIEINTTFTPWYCTEEYESKYRGYGCIVGVRVTLELSYEEPENEKNEATYTVEDITETG